MDKVKLRKFASSLGFWILIGLAVIWSFFPIFWALLNSIRPGRLMFSLPPQLFFTPTLNNFISLFEKFPSFIESYKNTVVLSLSSAFATVILSSMSAYALSRYRFFLKRGWSFFLIAIRLVPPIIITVPLFPLFHQFRLLDTYWGLGMLYVAFRVSFSTLLMKGFMDKVSLSQDGAALLDGCNSFQAFYKIILPQVLPGIAAVSIYNIILNWNDFLLAFIFTRVEVVTAPVRLKSMLGGVFGTEWGALFAATTILFVPVLVLTWLIQKYLIQGFNPSDLA